MKNKQTNKHEDVKIRDIGYSVDTQSDLAPSRGLEQHCPVEMNGNVTSGTYILLNFLVTTLKK